MKLWGGRFAASPAPELAGLPRAEERQFDLLRYDIEGSRAHIRELVRAGILTAAEFRLVEDALAEIGQRYASGDSQPGPGDENVHSLAERLGPELLGILSQESAVSRRSDRGATAPERVEEQLAELEHSVQDWRRWSGRYTGLRT